MTQYFKVFCLVLAMSLAFTVSMFAQVDKKDVRRGNRDFRKENYREADINYRKALVKDSLSIAANYNLASTLYRQGDMEQAAKVMNRIKESINTSDYPAHYYFNLGDIALAQKDYKTAVDAFKHSLVADPTDLSAKENYIYARKKLEDQQNNQNNQDNQNDDKNKDDKDQNDNKDQNKDQDQDQNDDKNNQEQDKSDKDKDQNKNQNQNQNQGQNNQPKITPQAAQQMLQAIQAKEKETQDKVKKEKAKALKSKQKDKNW